MNDNPRAILFVDDDDVFRRTACRALQRRGYEVTEAENGEAALARPNLNECLAAVIDLKMPGIDGLELLQRLGESAPDLPVILLTGHGDISTAIEAIKNGAFHYMTKPCDIQELDVYLQKAVQQNQIQRENIHLRDAMHRAQEQHGIVGDSPAVKQVLELIDRVKNSDAPALILGESGTGKELVARALHYQSQRSTHPFIDLNCATLKPDLLENELFGHVSGAFTGASNQKEGLLAVADQGSLFIDEIADMDPNVQASLLRVIETGEFRPLGSTKVRTTQTRIIAAANRDLAVEVSKGRFREDLYYRLNVLAITTPPLRAHKEDIPELIESYLKRSSAGRRGAHFTTEATHVLQTYNWPGNVRELFNICERAILLSHEPMISAQTVQSLLSMKTFQTTAATPPQPMTPRPAPQSGLRSLDDVEREHIDHTLQQVDGNVSRASDALGIDRRTLQRKMKRYGLRGE
ncbi:MAG: sigma-54 dependent transcriptional regulator [Candidatus Hinthialibacter antarcticus]|nr:sigma-54 dependent transcriptional regulator [Candidatus Hinthialibacter antarcticus]